MGLLEQGGVFFSLIFGLTKRRTNGKVFCFLSERNLLYGTVFEN
jgi:hypothetical protein